MLRAAAELMHVRGVHGTSLDDILTASETGKSQFHRYFRTKDELVRAVLRRQAEEWRRGLGDILERLDTWQGIEEWFGRILKRQTKQGFIGGCPVGTLAAEMADSDEALRVLLAKELRARRRYVAKGLSAMKKRGALVKSADPKALSEFVLATIQGGLLLASTEKNGRVLRHALDQALVHLRSFASTPPPTRSAKS